jgi:hypothetical protein
MSAKISGQFEAGRDGDVVPLAIFGRVSPLVAAIGVALSSAVVLGNSMRLGLNPQRRFSSRTDAA